MSSNRGVIPEARTPREAVALLRRLTALPGHEFWPDDVELTTSDLFDSQALVGHRQVADAHLLALALRRDGRLATLDRGVRHLVPQGRESSVVLVS